MDYKIDDLIAVLRSTKDFQDLHISCKKNGYLTINIFFKHEWVSFCGENALRQARVHISNMPLPSMQTKIVKLLRKHNGAKND